MTIDNLETVLNERQRHVLTRHLIYNHPVVVVNAPAACGKSRLLAYLMRLKARKNPAGLTVVALNSNKAARHLVALYDQIVDAQSSNTYFCCWNRIKPDLITTDDIRTTIPPQIQMPTKKPELLATNSRRI